ncbi:hypothetical protein, partial [Kitasatospora phosalacinea]
MAIAAPAGGPKAPAVPKTEQIPHGWAKPVDPPGPGAFAKYDPRVASQFPAAESAVVDLGEVASSGASGKTLLAGAGRGSVRAGNSPVVLAPVTGAARKAGSPAKVRVELADQSVARRAGVHGVLFSVGAEEGAGAVDVKVDPSSFRAAFGGDYAARLRLVRLPACVLTTPER